MNIIKSKSLFFLLLAVFCFSGCRENYNTSSCDQATERILGTWEVYGASDSPTGEILEAEDEFEGWSGPEITFYSDKTFSTEGIWDSPSSGTWSVSGEVYCLEFSNGDSERIIFQDGELYTDIYGMYCWLR